MDAELLNRADQLHFILATAAGVRGAAIISATGTFVAALIVAIGGGLISLRYNKDRDRQEKELQYRSHAIELTKLEHERKLRQLEKDPNRHLRPSILDFLANYRDLKELDEISPKDLYGKILKQRINPVAAPTIGAPSLWRRLQSVLPSVLLLIGVHALSSRPSRVPPYHQ